MKSLLLIWLLAIGHCLAGPGFYMNQQGVVASAFSPADISGLTLWLVADDISGSDGDAVATWSAHSPTSINATQGTAAARPSLQTAEVNNHNAVLSDEVNDGLLFSASISTAGSWTVISVQKRLNSGGLGGSIGALATTAGVGAPFPALEYGTLSRTYLASRTDQKYATINSQAWHVITSQDNAGTLVLRVDGSAQSLTAAAATGANNFDRMFYRAGSGSTEYWGTYIAELVVYTRALTTTEMGQIEAHFKAKYGTP